MLGINPLPHLTDVIDKIQNGWPKTRIGELVPDAWAAARGAAGTLELAVTP